MTDLDKNIIKSGVVCSLLNMSTGKVRVVLDDAVNTYGAGDTTWEHRNFFTFREFDSQSFEELELTESELADLGHSVLARLIALNNQTD